MDQKQEINLSKTFVEGEVHLGVWSFVKKAIGFVDSFFILRSLSLYQYGVYQLLLSLYAVMSDFFHDLFGAVASNDISRAVAEGKHAEAKRFFFEFATFRMLMACVASGIGFIGASFLSSRYGPDALLWVRLLSLLFIVEAALSIVSTLLKVHLEFKVLAIRPSLQKVIQGILLAYFFFFAELTLKEVFFAMLVGPLVTLVFLIPDAVRAYRPWKGIHAAPRGSFFRSIRAYGFWELPQSLTRNLIGKARPWVVKFFLGTEVVGIFGVAMTGISLLKDILPTRTLTALVPRAVDSREQMQKLFLYGTKYYVVMSVILIVVGAVGYPLGITFLFPQFIPSIPLFFLLLPTVFLFAFIKLTNIFLLVKRRQKYIFFQGLFDQTAGILALAIFLPVLGVAGVALAETVAITISVLVKYSYLTKTGFVAPIPVGEFFKITATDRDYFGQVTRHARGLFSRHR